MARQRPKNLDALGKLRGIAGGFVGRHGEAVLGLIHQAQQTPREQWPTLPKIVRLSAAEDAQVDALNAIIKLCAARYRINATNLTNRKELERLVTGERDLAILKGWRLHHGGALLLEFLEGKSALRIVDKALTVET